MVAVWVGVTAVGAFLRPNPAGHGTHQQLGLPPCPVVVLYERPCPGCGLTTSFTNTIQGNFAAAFAAHPIGPLLYLGLAICGVASLVGLVRGFRFRTEEGLFFYASLAITLLILVVGVYRFFTLRITLLDSFYR